MSGTITAAVILGTTIFAIIRMNVWTARYRATLTLQQRKVNDDAVDDASGW